jgi:hypothetical protein
MRVPTKIRLPIGEPDLTAIKSVIDDWLVPLLVREFMAEYNAKAATEAVKSQQMALPPKGSKARNDER